jgi:hypothetical protein
MVNTSPTRMPPTLSPLYSTYLTSAEKRLIPSFPVNDISSEIKLLRFLTALFLKFQQTAPDDLASRMQALITFTQISAQLAVMVQALKHIHALSDDLVDPLEEALDIQPFDLSPDAHDYLEPICPKNAALRLATGMPANTASIPNTSAILNAGPFPISPIPT